MKILKEMSIRLEKAENQIQALTVQDVEHRLANALLKMADDKNFINLLISKKDLAHTLEQVGNLEQKAYKL